MSENPDLGFIHRFEPAGNPAEPILLLLHGTGGDENDLISLGRTIAPESALLSPRGKVLENGVPRFFRRLAEGVFDLQDLAHRTAELAHFLDWAALRYSFLLDRLVAVGFSNGANIAASLLLSFPDRLAGAILIRAMLPYVPNTVPSLLDKPILLLNGQLDPIVPLNQPEQLATVFRTAGAEVTLQWRKAGHALTQADVVAAMEWLSMQRFKPSAKLNYS
jgi:phospholipase/carboxylesterase